MTDIAVIRLYINDRAPYNIQNRRNYNESSQELNAVIQTMLMEQLPGTHKYAKQASDYQDIWDIHITIVNRDGNNDHITFDMDDGSKLHYKLPYRLGRKQTIFGKPIYTKDGPDSNKANEYLNSYHDNGPIKRIIEFIKDNTEVESLIIDQIAKGKKTKN